MNGALNEIRLMKIILLAHFGELNGMLIMSVFFVYFYSNGWFTEYSSVKCYANLGFLWKLVVKWFACMQPQSFP